MRERKGMDLDGREGGGELKLVEGQIIISIYYVWKKLFSIIRKIKGKNRKKEGRKEGKQAGSLSKTWGTN